MPRLSFSRISAILFFLLLVVGAAYSLQRVGQDIDSGKYFHQIEEFRYDAAFLFSYLLITILVLLYGFYLAVHRVDWKTIKNDFLYLLNKKYFSRTEWIINLLIFWLALAGFIYALAVSAMKGNL